MIYIEIVVYNSVSEMWVRLRVHHIGFTKLNNENKLFQRYHKDYGRRDGEGEIIFRHSILGKLFDVREGVGIFLESGRWKEILQFKRYNNTSLA